MFLYLKKEILQVASYLGVGFFRYGHAKIESYAMARDHLGALVAQIYFSKAPVGIITGLQEDASACAALTRILEKSKG